MGGAKGGLGIVVPVRASVYPAGSGTVTGTGDITLDGSTYLVYEDDPESPGNAIVEVISRKFGRIIYGEFAEFRVQGTDTFDYDLTSFVFTKEFEPLPDGTNVQVFIYPINKYIIEGPKIAANGDTINLQVVGVDFSTHRVTWRRNNGYNYYETIGSGETCTFVKSHDVEIIFCGVDPL